MSSFTHSHPTTAGVDDDDLVLWLHCKRGDALASPPPLPLLKPRKAKGRRITLTETDSSEVVEGRTLPRGREVPLPIWRDALTLSKKENSLLKAPQGVSSNEEPPIEMTSRSIMDCSIEIPESLPLMSMAELDKNEDIVEGKIP